VGGMPPPLLAGRVCCRRTTRLLLSIIMEQQRPCKALSVASVGAAAQHTAALAAKCRPLCSRACAACAQRR
jgi:hypothetical protein